MKLKNSELVSKRNAEYLDLRHHRLFISGDAGCNADDYVVVLAFSAGCYD